MSLHVEAIERLNLKNKPHLIWNCDESGLPHEPKKCQVVPEKGQNTILVRAFFSPSTIQFAFLVR